MAGTTAGGEGEREWERERKERSECFAIGAASLRTCEANERTAQKRSALAWRRMRETGTP
eukprot:1430749-Pleurochrysis_carterae.AAC.2